MFYLTLNLLKLEQSYIAKTVYQFNSTERFFQSSVITSESTAMDTTGSSVAQVVDPADDLAPDKSAPDLRSP